MLSCITFYTTGSAWFRPSGKYLLPETLNIMLVSINILILNFNFYKKNIDF